MAIQEQSYVNVAGVSLFDTRITETNGPRWPYEGNPKTPYVQTIPFLARGAIKYTSISLSNNNLSHACDVSLILPSINLAFASLTQPISVLTDAIKNGKLRAAAMIRAALTSLVNLFRESLDAIVVALGFDPTGITNVSVTIGKDLVRQITAKLKSIAQYIEDAATVYYLIKDIQNIIAWVQTLPAKIKAIIQQCLNNLNNSITTVQNQLKSLASSIPNQLNASATQVTTQLSQGLTATANALKTSSSSANGNIDPALVPIVGGSTSNSDLANLSTYLTKTNPSTAQAMQNTYGSQASTKTSP